MTRPFLIRILLLAILLFVAGLSAHAQMGIADSIHGSEGLYHGIAGHHLQDVPCLRE